MHSHLAVEAMQTCLPGCLQAAQVASPRSHCGGGCIAGIVLAGCAILAGLAAIGLMALRARQRPESFQRCRPPARPPCARQAQTQLHGLLAARACKLLAFCCQQAWPFRAMQGTSSHKVRPLAEHT